MRHRAASNVSYSLRVAALATAIVVVLAVLGLGTFDLVVAHRITSQNDARLADQLTDARVTLPSSTGSAETEPRPHAETSPDYDVDDAPVFVWHVGADGLPVSSEAGAPKLTRNDWPRGPGPQTVVVSSVVLRVQSTKVPGGWLVAGVSLASQRHIENLLLEAELVAAPIVVLGMFFGSLLIGIKASAPVVVARRRQLEFTADASHELRTPLTVIEAEVDLALGKQRDAGSYRQSLENIGGESRRLARIVDDLLWLARFDSTPPPPSGQVVDMGAVAGEAAARFGARAAARSISLSSVVRADRQPLVDAPVEWMDRLAGVLVDNACRYAPAGGHVEISVAVRGGRVSLRVEDDGPGIAPEDRPLLFDRFHRATDAQGGTGLGLAIADSIVRSTGGRWTVGDSALGGALMEVSWPSSHVRVRRQPQPRADTVQEEQAERDAGSQRRDHHPLTS